MTIDKMVEIMSISHFSEHYTSSGRFSQFNKISASQLMRQLTIEMKALRADACMKQWYNRIKLREMTFCNANLLVELLTNVNVLLLP